MNGRVNLVKPKRTRPRIVEVEEITRRKSLVVWWHGAITKNTRAQSVPLVVVFFKEIDELGNLASKFIKRPLAMTHLGFLRIGTVWKEGYCIAEIEHENEEFNVDFTRGTWKFVSPSIHGGLIKECDYPLRFQDDKNWLISFRIDGGKNVLIPCIEVFSRLYGRSQVIKRVLATFPWDKVRSKIFSQDQVSLSGQGGWFVKLTRRMVNGDVILAAHIEYDNYTSEAAKEIYSQIENQTEGGDKLAFVKIRPWFEGRAQVSLRGCWVNDGKTFLALRIQGCSDPKGDCITRDRDNTNQVDETTIDDGLGSGWAGAGSRSMLRAQEIIDLTDAQEPDNGSETVELEEDEFEVIGTPRVVYDQKRGRLREKSGRPRSAEHLDTFSTGEAFSSGKGVGWASIHAPVVMESRGMLRDMWNAMLYAMRVYPELIQRVEWFTFDEDFCPALEPKLIPLQPFDEHEPKDNDVRNWVYYDVQHQVPRGVLVARLTIGQRHVFVLEIQRRARTNEDESKVSEEAFQGLVFLLRKSSDFEARLGSLLSDMRSVKGVVKRLEAGFQGEAHAFKHSASRDEKVPGEAALWNALGKVGVKMPMQSGVETTGYY